MSQLGAEVRPMRRVACDADRVRDSAGRPLLELPETWAGVPVLLNHIPGRDVQGPTFCELPTVLVATDGQGRRRYRVAGRELTLDTAPRMVELYAAGYEMDRLEWDGSAGRCVALQFDPPLLRRLLHDEAPAFDVRTQHALFDDRVATIAELLLDEARRGGSSGAAYAEGLTLALLSCLKGSEQWPAARREPRLSSRQRRLVEQHIDQHLGEDLSVSRLAALAALSPDHFARAFKGSFGTTPHRYVQQRRVERALHWLRDDASKPIVEIAVELGFASQAHFTEVFRRITGRTPARVRQH